MIIKMAGNLRMDIDIPMLNCDFFEILWKPNEHASLKLEGYLQADAAYHIISLYESQIKVWSEDASGDQVLFWGRLTNVIRTLLAGTEKVCIEGKSETILLDRVKRSQSFQDAELTFYEIIKQVAAAGDGQVICTADKTKKIEKPVIQYEETDWEFCRRLASNLRVPVMPDVETGNPCFWVGMRKGGKTASFSEAWYIAEVDIARVRYRVKDVINYKLGDRTVFMEQEMTVCEKRAVYQQGQVHYYYLLENEQTIVEPVMYQQKFTGMSLSGAIQTVKGETVSILLDIDHGGATGEYFYNWIPETGNALYAMPEPGAPVSLYFGSEDEQGGMVIHCLHEEQRKVCQKADAADRVFDILGERTVQLFEGAAVLSKNKNHSLSVGGGRISTGTSGNLEISAEGKIKLKARTITVDSSDEIGIYQG